MPRLARPWDPGSIYHVDARAHGGAPIFVSDDDRAFVVGRAAEVFRECGVTCLAWAVLVNHYHLVVRSAGPPGRALLRLNTAIARRVRRHGGEGAVFQGRFFSSICTDEASFLTRLAYVTANAVHHRVVPTVDALYDHPWSSLGEAAGLREPRLLDAGALFALLDDGAHPTAARTRLHDLCVAQAQVWDERDRAEDGRPRRSPDDDDPPAPTVRIGRRLSDELGAPRTLGAVAGPPLETAWDWTRRASVRAALVAEGWTPDRLVPVAAALVAADPDAVRRGGRARAESAARAVVAFVGAEHLGFPIARIAETVGAGISATFRAIPRGRAVLAETGLDAEEVVARSRRVPAAVCGGAA